MAASLSLSQIPVAGIEKSLDFFNQELIWPDKGLCKWLYQKILHLKSFFLFFLQSDVYFRDILTMSLGNGL